MHWFLAWLAITVVGNLIGYIAIGRDKRAARKGRRRRPEDTFSVLALLGWWPGMLISMKVHRHKTKKRSFQRQLALTAVVGTGIWGIVAYGAWIAHG